MIYKGELILTHEATNHRFVASSVKKRKKVNKENLK